MTTEEKKTIDMIRQVRETVEGQTVSLEQFPLQSLANLIRATIGREFIGITGGMKNEDFVLLTDGYLKLLKHCIEMNDIQGCVKTLVLLEEQYVCLDTIIRAYREQRYVDKYKKMTIGAGEAYSEMQYYLHQNKRKRGMQGRVIGENGKGVVYTCTFFAKNEVQQPEYINLNWDYICFTSVKEKIGTRDGVWEYRGIGIENQGTDELRHICMMNPHLLLEEYDYSIWVDPNYKIVGDLELFLASYGRDVSFLAFPSYITDDVYEVMATGLRGDDENICMRKKCLQYEKEGYPRHYGMISDKIMIRNHRDDKMCKVMETWWNEAVQCGRMWQYGFNYAAWKNGFDYSICDLFVEMNAYFKSMLIDLEVQTNE
ncbi:MAG: hypothetical protein IJ324_11880 [Lachnospiraceae bacterium]|nr:hypothetical protein [Lachnospiraceae bacterium]